MSISTYFWWGACSRRSSRL